MFRSAEPASLLISNAAAATIHAGGQKHNSVLDVRGMDVEQATLLVGQQASTCSTSGNAGKIRDLRQQATRYIKFA